MSRTTIELTYAMGDHVKDKVTGFAGVVTAFSTAITGCDQYLVNPPAKDGEYKRGEWLDDVRLELVEANVVTLEDPRPDPRRNGAAPEGPPPGRH
jgi:hypothetical protein